MLFHKKDNSIEDFLVDHFPRPKSQPLWPKSLIFLLALFLILAVALAPLAYNGYRIYGRLKAINDRVDSIMSSVGQNNFEVLAKHLDSTEEDLIAIRLSAKNLGPILWLPAVAKTYRTGDTMLKASADLLSGYQEFVGVFSDLQTDTGEGAVTMNFSQAAGRRQILGAIVKNRQKLEQAKTKIILAKTELNSINTDDLTGVWKSKVIKINQLLSEVIGQSESALPLFKYLPELAGYNHERNYLVLFENNMELRPTGGFIGSYGLVTFKDGEITKVLTDDIYNLDKLSKDKLFVTSPWPIEEYGRQKYLFMRDANWSPDWPTAAKQLKWFFDIERKNANLPQLEVDGIIAITPDFIANLLSATGPLTVDGITFTDKNFTLELEKQVEFDYVHKGLDISQRKDIIGDLTKTIVDRIEGSSPNQLLSVWSVMQKNINQKNILAWLSDQELQDYFSQQNWAGEVKGTDSDYLFIVDSNMAALKTDSVMKRFLNHGVYLDDTGELNARAEITYQHSGQKVQDLIGKYRTYTRVYVPEKTQFTKVYLKDKKGITVFDINKDVAIGDEFGKRYAGVFLEVDPLAEKTLVLEYRLPEQVKKTYQKGWYSLLLQKQPGTTGHKLKIDLRFDQNIIAYHADFMPEVFLGRQLTFDGDLIQDREFKVKF